MPKEPTEAMARTLSCIVVEAAEHLCYFFHSLVSKFSIWRKHVLRKGHDLPESGAGKDVRQWLRRQLAPTRGVTPAASWWTKVALASEATVIWPTTETIKSTRFGAIIIDGELGNSEDLQWQNKGSYWWESHHLLHQNFELYRLSEEPEKDPTSTTLKKMLQATSTFSLNSTFLYQD